MTSPAARQIDASDDEGTARAHLAVLRAVTTPAVDDLAAEPVWWARLAHRDRVPVEHSLVAVGSGRFPHGSAVDLTAVDPGGRRPTGWLVDVRYRASDGAVVRLAAAPDVAVPEIPLWFAEIAHATSDLPSASLVAFRGEEFPAGSLVTPREVCARGLAMTGNVGEIRWWTRSGLIETVTVPGELAGLGVGRMLTALAGGMAKLRNWPPLVHELTMHPVVEEQLRRR